MVTIRNTGIVISLEPLGQKKTSAPTGSFLIRHLIQAPCFRTLATFSRRFGSNFARLGLGRMVIAEGAVRRLAVGDSGPDLRLFGGSPAAPVLDAVDSTSPEVYSVAGKHGPLTETIVARQRGTAMCRKKFSWVSHISGDGREFSRG